MELVLEPPERKLPGGELLEKIKDEASEHRSHARQYRRPTPTQCSHPSRSFLSDRFHVRSRGLG